MLRLSLFLLLFCSFLTSHTIKPAYLQIKSIGDNHYDVQWKTPLVRGKKSLLMPIYPAMCRNRITKHIEDSNIYLVASTLECKKGLLGETISIKHIEKEMRSVIFHFSQHPISYFSEFTPTHPSIKIKHLPHRSPNILQSILLGIKHILLGYDHLLFILALLLLIQRIKVLIGTITAFTVSHSISLGAVSLGYLSVSEIFIEIMIALSILILAVEILYLQRAKIGLSTKYPWGAALLFGLIHGFGFANVLASLNLPQERLFYTLLFFNLGIELGQILFIASLLLLYRICRLCIEEKTFMQIKTTTAYIIGTIASFWCIERTAAIFTY